MPRRTRWGPKAGAPRPNVCKVADFDELLRCVRFLADRDEVCREIARAGYNDLACRMLSREGIVGRAAEALEAAAAIGMNPAFDAHTHPLFGALNFEYVTKGGLQ
jgi:hypothetical protein